MTRRFVSTIGIVVLSLSAGVSDSHAQNLPEHRWSRGTTLELLGGGAMGPSAAERGVLGGGVAWEINQRISLEGTTLWLFPRQADEAFAADLKALVNLTRPNTAVPFVTAGFGLYRASFDLNYGALPAFYEPRLTTSAGTRPTFTDPSFVAGGGVTFFAARHLSIRPDVLVRLATREGRTYPVTIAAVHVIYHFEAHDVPC